MAYREKFLKPNEHYFRSNGQIHYVALMNDITQFMSFWHKLDKKSVCKYFANVVKLFNEKNAGSTTKLEAPASPPAGSPSAPEIVETPETIETPEVVETVETVETVESEDPENIETPETSEQDDEGVENEASEQDDEGAEGDDGVQS